MIQSRHLKGAAYPGFSGWVINAITCILIRRTHRGGDTQTEKEDGSMTTEAETRGSQKSRNAASQQRMQGTRKDSPWRLWRECESADPLISDF